MLLPCFLCCSPLPPDAFTDSRLRVCAPPPPVALPRPDALYVGYRKRRRKRDLYCIIIENACPPGGDTVLYKRVAGCSSVPHLMLACRALARMHARWWGCKQAGVLGVFPHPHWAGGCALPKLPRALVKTFIVLVFK